jgi:hypothetical protein
MELIIALVLFVGIIGAWVVLPSAPTEEAAGHSATPAATPKAGQIA